MRIERVKGDISKKSGIFGVGIVGSGKGVRPLESSR